MARSPQQLSVLAGVMIPIAVIALLWAILNLPTDIVTVETTAVFVVTILLGGFLRVQLPRSSVHVTISDAAIIFALIRYGGPFATLLAAVETLFTSGVMWWGGKIASKRTAALNASISTLVAASAYWVIYLAFGGNDIRSSTADTSALIVVLSIAAVTMFTVNVALTSPCLSIRLKKPFTTVFSEYYPDALVVMLVSALIAGLCLTAINQSNPYLMVSAIGFFAMVFWVYHRNVGDVRRSNEQAERAERERAEQAEKHVSELTHYISELEKTSEALRRGRERFRHAAYHDALTGLPNRNQLVDAIRMQIEKKRRNVRNQFAILFLDLDRFKTVNDSLGHSTGDKLLRGVAERITSLLTDGQMAGRFSGDEFAIMSPVADLDQAPVFAQRVAAALAEPFHIDGRKIFTSVSIGITYGSPNYSEAEEMLRDADIAMYYAKEAGKAFEIFDQNMHAQAVSLLQLETDLRSGIDRNEIELYYQPIIDLGETRLAGFEALVRWNHPKHGVIPPSDFIPVCEATGLIIPLTLKILRMACKQMVAWQREYRPEHALVVSVNLSGRHFSQPDLVDQLKTILSETGLSPAHLKLEITESAVMENAERAIEVLKEIRDIGVKLSIDDFGTGHSSLSYLHRFPIDTLKVDRSFVCTMEDGSENGEIVRTVIALAKILKLTVIAEGIESIHQFHQLRVLGCEFGQGYLFSRPLPIKEVERLLTEKFNWENVLPMPEFGSIAQNKEYSQLRIN